MRSVPPVLILVQLVMVKMYPDFRPDARSGAPSATAAQLIQPDLASGLKSGYIFTITNCTKINTGGTDRITGYSITAIPQTVGSTGDRAYCADQSGIIKFDPAGGTNCTQTLGQ